MNSEEIDFYKTYNKKVDNLKNPNQKSTGDISYKKKTEKSEKKKNIKIHKDKILKYNKNIKENGCMLKQDWFKLENIKENEINEQNDQNDSDLDENINDFDLEEYQEEFNNLNVDELDKYESPHPLNEKIGDYDLDNLKNITENNEAHEGYKIQNGSEINSNSNESILVYPTKLLIVG